MTRKWITSIVVVLVIVVGLAAVRMKRMKEKNAAPLLAQSPPAVQVAPVTQGRVTRTEHVLGVVKGGDEVAVIPRIMGQVLEVPVREGESVRKGQVLARLDPREIQDAVSQAEAGVEAARQAQQTQLEATARDKVLFEAKAISQEQWDRSRTRAAVVKAKLTVAERKLDQARTRLDYTILRSPCDGVVSARLADPGNMALPGRPLLKVVHQGSVRVRASVPPEDLTSLHVGQPVRLTLGKVSVNAKLSRVFPAMGKTHLATFETDLPRPPAGFVSGATVGVDVELESAEGLTVPADALLQGEEQTVIFQVVSSGDKNATVHLVPATVLSRSLNEAVVSADLKAGDQVVIARPSRLMTLTEGAPVIAVSPKTAG